MQKLTNGGKNKKMNNSLPELNQVISAFDLFLKKVESTGIDIKKGKKSPNSDDIQYIISFNLYMIDFVCEISGIPKDFSHQFIALNKFKYIVDDVSTKLILTINVNKQGFYLKLGNGLVLHNILIVSIDKNHPLKITCTYRNRKITEHFTYEHAYMLILNRVQFAIAPKLIDSKKFLEVYNTPVDSIIIDRLKPLGIQYVTPAQFCQKYADSTTTESIYINLDMCSLNAALKDMFPFTIYKKLLQIVSLCSFEHYLEVEPTNPEIAVAFNKISKFSDVNRLFTFIFFDLTLSFHDDGSFHYDNHTVEPPISLRNLDDIYNQLLEEIVNKVTAVLHVEQGSLTSNHIKLYKMITY
jgi:hypothetical protein